MEPIKVEVEIDINKHLRRFTGYNPETGDDFSEPQTLEDLVIGEAARIAAVSVTSGLDMTAMRRKIDALVNERATALITDAVSAFVNKPMTPTDNYGRPKGDPVTFAEVIEAKVDALLTQKNNADRYDHQKVAGTVIEQQIHAAVKDGVAKQVKAAVAAQRDAIVARVAAESAAVLTEGLKRAVTA